MISATELVLALAFVYVPGVRSVFSMVPVSPSWLLAVPIGAALFTAIDRVRRGARSRSGISMASSAQVTA